MTADSRAEWPFAIPARTARDHVEHRLHGAHRIAVGIADGDRFRGTRQAGIGGVDVKIEGRFGVARHDRTVVPVDIVEPVDKPGNVIKIGHGAFAVLAGFEIHDGGGGTAGAGMYTPRADLQIVDRVNAVKREPAPRAGDDILDQRARKPQATILINTAAGLGRAPLEAWRDLRKAQILEKPQGEVMDTLRLRPGQRLELAPCHAGRDRGRRGRCPGATAPPAVRPTNRAIRHGQLAAGFSRAHMTRIEIVVQTINSHVWHSQGSCQSGHLGNLAHDPLQETGDCGDIHRLFQ